MRSLMTKTGLGVAAMAAVLSIGTAANAGVTSCSATGGKQEGGAVIGALVGGLIGHSVGGRHATGETVAGAALGAAAGSAIGCEAQKSSAQPAAYRSGTYKSGGYRLSSAIQPARFDRVGQAFVAEAGVNLRAAPTTNSARVGRLQAGQRFDALAQVRGSDWILVGQNGVGVGYVRSDFVRPAGYRYATR